MASIVENGTAPDERLPQMKKLRKNPILNTTAGYNVAVYNTTKFNLILKKQIYQFILKLLFVSNLNL
jgi:hypothetical protein